MALLEVQDIYKRYRRKEVLCGVSLTAGSGDCIGILGSNGSGKSTLLRTLAGVLKADRGAFRYDGAELLVDPIRRAALVGYVPQGTPLLGELTALDNLRLWYRPEALRLALDGGVLEALGVTEFLKVPVYRLSGGMKKRLSIGCALHHDPRVLLLDEPSAALDLAAREAILDYLRVFRRSGGILLLATHDLRELSECSTCCLLRNGRAEPYVYTGDVAQLTEDLQS